MARIMLHNRTNTEELRARVSQSAEPRTTLSFYRYLRILSPDSFRDALYQSLSGLGVLGRIYVAHEGINAQTSVPTERLPELQTLLEACPGLGGLRLNLAVEDDDESFFKLIVRVRPKIVADGLDDEGFDPAAGGRHLDAAGFNELAGQPGTVVVDMRNHYESEVGYFEGAIRPPVDTFRESLPIVEEMLRGREDAPVLMYCTGGIRCEKASAWLRHRGFNDVYQLDGGIINYARQVETEDLPNRFRGKNFVFDERLGEQISRDVVSQCHQCGAPCDRHVNCVNDHCHLLFLQCEACAKTYRDACSHTCAEVAPLSSERRRGRASELTFNGQRHPNGHYRADHGPLALD